MTNFDVFMQNLESQQEYRASCIEAAREWGARHDASAAGRAKLGRAAKRHEAPRSGRSAELELITKLAEDRIRMMSPAAKREVARLVEAWELKRRAVDAERSLLRAVHGPRISAGMESLPHKTLSHAILRTKSAGDGSTFTFYAAAFNNIDRQGDVIIPGAFSNLDEFVRAGWIAKQHDNSGEPIGFPLSATQDSHGLRVEAEWHSTPSAQEWKQIVRQRLDAGKDVAASIGYVVNDAHQDRVNGQMVRIITDLSVYEASIVLLPANPQAGFR